MTACRCMPEDLAQVRAQLEEERLARARAEGRAEGLREALALLASARQPATPGPMAEAPVTPQRHAGSVTGQRDGVTSSVTRGGGEDRKKALARGRSAAYRARNRSVTGQRDGVTSSVTQEEEKKKEVVPSSPPPARAHGRLSLVTVAARDGQRDGPREHRTPDTLPPDVASLRAGWNELVAPHGFAPWGERTSATLLRDALGALERRPLEEWLRVFSLVPRSPVCRGDLKRKQRTCLAFLLTGKLPDGYEPAEKLLSGAWSVDPLPTPTLQRPDEAPPEDELAALPEDTPAAAAWKGLLSDALAGGKAYAVRWLVLLRARELRDGVLVLEAKDTYARDWSDGHYAPLLAQLAAQRGLSAVRVEVAAQPSAAWEAFLAPEGGAP